MWKERRRGGVAVTADTAPMPTPDPNGACRCAMDGELICTIIERARASQSRCGVVALVRWNRCDQTETSGRMSNCNLRHSVDPVAPSICQCICNRLSCWHDSVAIATVFVVQQSSPQPAAADRPPAAAATCDIQRDQSATTLHCRLDCLPPCDSSERVAQWHGIASHCADRCLKEKQKKKKQCATE